MGTQPICPPQSVSLLDSNNRASMPWYLLFNNLVSRVSQALFGCSLVTTVGSPGSDASVPSEAAVRAAIMGQGSNYTIDANGFTAWGGTPLNDSTARGYVVSNIDHTFVNQDNEARGVSAVVRASRTTLDEATNGWDQFGLAGVVVMGPMNLPSDPVFGSPYIRGQQKSSVSELYYQTSTAAYTAKIGMNYLATLPQVGTGVTLDTWAGVIIATPGFIGPNGGHVVNAYGFWVQNLQEADNILDPTNVAAGRIDGFGNFSRIMWTEASISCPSAGVLEFSGNVKVSATSYANNAAAVAAGLSAGMLYQVTGTDYVGIVH